MGTQETLTKLLGQKLVQRVYKIGGQHFGPIDVLNVLSVIQSVLGLFGSIGRPVGLVFSAPQGFTQSLREMLELARTGRQDEALSRFGLAMDGLYRSWRLMAEELANAVPPEKRAEYQLFVAGLDHSVKRSILSFKNQMHSLLRFGYRLDPDRAEAKVLSMGERSFGEIVMSPLCRIMTESFERNFVYLDPLSYVVSKPGQSRSTELDPDVDESSNRLRDAISLRQKRMKGGDITFVMPGFYLGMEYEWKIGTMPFNGSDISAYILSLAFGLDPIELVYIKRVMGDAPTDIQSLVDQQNASTGVDGKRSELVATFVLEQLKDTRRDLQLYNTTTGTFHIVPVAVGVSTS
jgi:aspartokinase